MNKYDYTAKKHPALQTERYVPVTVNVPDKYDLVGNVSELLAAMHAVDMETVEDDAVGAVEQSPMVTDAWVRLTMAIEELAKDMGTEATFGFVPATSQQPNDPMGIYDATGKLYKAIESKDIEVALSHVKYMEEIARTYADPRSAAHDPFNLLELTEKLNSAIDAEDKSEANDVLAELAEKVQDGMKRAKADREFNENN
ncbi:hypothetical protein [Weissella confusa]|uniref:hypothetical protein n=1 Tax=Weissella confusa TaxID=1583 RepID=UPI0018F1FE57|nr:hypothetical protein [Weissella confusa]MBJ7650353.1 hypothetical protein [Weissella confusa]MBJ7651791.1 hypothetical protein [Weissella confusa]MBJ7662242.1 hypothetical protein [Weissella confusa]